MRRHCPLLRPPSPHFKAKAFLKTANGVEPIPIVSTLSEGALSVQINVPDMETPFFVIFETPKGIWKADEYSIREATATARRQEGG